MKAAPKTSKPANAKGVSANAKGVSANAKGVSAKAPAPAAPAPEPEYTEYPLDFAVKVLRHFFRQFPFADWTTDQPTPTSRSFAVHIAAMLSQFCGHLIPRHSNRMGFFYNANTQRSGKTLLAQTAIIPVHGTFRAQSWPDKDDDMRKLIDSEILGGVTYICFDNVRGMIASPILEALMTTSHWAGRVLGKSQNFEAPNNATIFVTGNNLNPSIDMQHRTLLCELFVAEADPTQRTIEAPLSASMLADWKVRKQLLSCLWSLVIAWDKAGRPGPPGFLRPGFEEWGRVIGGIVHHAGFGNPLALPPADNSGKSREEIDILELVTQLAIASRPSLKHSWSFQEIVNICWQNNIFSWIIEDGKESIDSETREAEWILKPSATSKLGRLLSTWMPTTNFRIIKASDTGETVRLACTGKQRHRRYTLER